MQNSEMDKEVNGSQDKILSPSDLNLPSTSQQTVAVSRTEENSEELKNVISKAQALAKKMASNVPTDQITRSLLKGALDKLVLAQNNILESEKSKLKSMQETDQRINNNQITQEVQSTSSNTNLRQNSQVMLGNQSLTSNINMRPKIQRSYKLTAKSSFEVWLDCLKTELTSWMLLYLVDSKIPEPTGISETETILRKNSVKDIIISHIDEEYHKKILGMTEPMEILQKLRESRKGEVISTPTSIRTKLYNLRMNKGEKVHKFCERFDQIVREHELSDDPQKLTDQEKRSTFYQAIIGVMPEIRRTDSAVITTTGKEMSMEALRKAMIRIQEDNDADIRDSDVREPTASRVNSFKAKPNKSKCYRCNRSGHWQQECPLLVPNRWFCYICNCETDHKGEDCPNKFQRPSQGHNKRPFNKTFDSSGPPSKRNKFTSSQHAHSKGIASFKGDRGRGRSHTRGRGFHRGLRNGSNVRRAEYNVEDENSALDGDGYDDNHECDQNQDSGATEHIVNKSFILSDFKISNKGVIKSANKNDFADIVIDGRGNLLIKNNSNVNIIKLTNVIAAKDISENLLSLRKLVDAGLSIHLDDKIFRVYNKENNKTIFEGIYEKPNWIVRFQVKKSHNEIQSNEYEYDDYSCIACMATNNEFSEQSQTSVENKQPSVSKGADSEFTEESVIGRENLEEPIVSSTQTLNSEFIFGECDSNLTFLKTIKIDDLNSIESVQELITKNPTEVSKSDSKLSEAMLWHIRLGHASLNYLRKLQKHEKVLQNVNFDETIRDCEVCILSKMEKLPFKQNRSRAERPLQMIHSDLMGPIKPTSWPGQKRFIATFVDDYSRYARIYCLKSKDETGQALENYLVSARNLLGTDAKVCYIRSDRGTEYTGGKFAEVMKKENIESDCGPPYTPQLNGTAERFNKTIQRTIRALMCDSGLPASMWELAAETAVHTYNITPHKSINYDVPILKFSPNATCHLEQIKRFGCIAYIKLPKTETKFSNVSLKTVLVGHTGTGSILWHPDSRKFFESRNVRFLEKLVYKDVYKKSQNEINMEVKETEHTPDLQIEFLMNEPTKEQENLTEEIQMPNSENLELNKVEPKKRGRPKKTDLKKDKQNSEQNKEQSIEQAYKNVGPVTRSKTKKIEDISFARYSKFSEADTMNEDELGHILLASIQRDPITFTEAINSEDKVFWQQAINEELNSMKENDVWEIVDRPKQKPNGEKPNVIDSKWIFKKKVDADGKTKYKARLVIRGFKDKNIYDLKETYAPVSRLSLIRATISTINKENLEMCQMDVKTAFLNGEIEDEVFIEIPEGIENEENVKIIKVCKLKRSIYGLKISAKNWSKKFSEELRKLGLENDLHDPCLFTWRKNGKVAFIILYVDDMLIASNDPKKLQQIKDYLCRVFKMKDLGEPKDFLGMTIQRNKEERNIILHQAAYTEKILQKFNMGECKPQKTPMITRQVKNRNNKLKNASENSEIVEEMKKVPYREAIGSLMYLANATRPDIAFAVNYLARKQVEPTEDDWNDVKRVFRYLRGTTNLGIKFTSDSEKLEALTDSSFRDCENSSSTGGYVIKLFGDVIAWRSHKQSNISLSTCHAEYLAMSDACQELISLDKSIRYILGRTMFPVTIWCDNRSARDCTEMDGSHKLKTFDQSLEMIQRDLVFREETGTRKPMAESHGDFIKQCVDEKKVKVLWVPTKENLADIMTKPLAEKEFTYLRDKIINTNSNCMS